MAPFDSLNIVVASVVGGIALLYIIIAVIIHNRFKVKLQSGEGLDVYEKTAKREVAEAIDNRRRIYYTDDPCHLIVNQYNQFEEQKGRDNLKYFKFKPRKRALGWRRFFRVIFLILYILGLICVLLSAGLIIFQAFASGDITTYDFFNTIPEVVKFFLSYNTLMIAFGVMLISIVSFNLICASIRTYRICESFYLERLNMDEVNRAFEPIRIKVKVNAQNN